MGKQKAKKVEEVVVKAAKRGSNRDPQGLSKLAMKYAEARVQRQKVLSTKSV